jgi:hypothetical protein
MTRRLIVRRPACRTTDTPREVPTIPDHLVFRFDAESCEHGEAPRA